MSGDRAGAGTGQHAATQPAAADPAPADPAPADPAAEGAQADRAAEGAQAGSGHKGKSHGGAGAGGWDVPWAESPVTAAAPGRAELELAFATAMRRTGSLMQLMGQAAADRIGINATDLNCLNILSFSG